MGPKFILTILCLTLLALPSQGQLINGDFETGDLYGWSFSGFDNAQVSGERHGLKPFNGRYMFSEIISGFSNDARIWQTPFLQPGSYLFEAMFQAETTGSLVYEPGYINPNTYMHSKSTGSLRIDLDGTGNWENPDRYISGIATGFLWKPTAISFSVDQPKSVSLYVISQQSDNWGGHWTAIDNVKLTPITPATGPANPALANGDFEAGMTGWTGYGAGGTEGGYFGVVPCQGSTAWHAIANGNHIDGGVYQTLTLTPGVYTVRACAQASSSRCFFEYPFRECSPWLQKSKPDAWVSIRIDLDGGNNPNEYGLSSGQFQTDFQWQNVEVNFRVTRTGPVTIFLDGRGAPEGYAGTWLAFDDVSLTGPSEPTPDATLGAYRTMADGEKVTVPSGIVTADVLDIGAAYVQVPDRSSGIRVEPLFDENYHVQGELTKVTGYMSTKPGGERFISTAVFQPFDYTDPAKALTMRNSHVAAQLPDNVGLLVRTVGRVTTSGENFIYIADGSPTELRVDLSALAGATYSEGQWLDITGLSRLEGVDDLFLGQPVLHPRYPTDIVVLN